MKMKRNIISILLSATILTSCTTNFEDYNKNPYGVTDDVLASGGVVEKVSNNCGVLIGLVIPLQENLFQNAMSLGCEVFSGYMAQTKHIDLGKYNYNNGFIEYPFRDNQSLTKVIEQYNSLSVDTKASHENAFYAWGTILKVAILHRLTDMYGPIPYEFSGNEAQKPYQNQEQIYRKMIEELTWASQTLQIVVLKPNEFKAWSTQDDVYKGNTQKWALFANSLKLRLAMRLSAKLPQEAKKWAEEAVNNGVIENNSDNAIKPTLDNPFYKVSITWGDTRCGADIIEYMNAFNDPRREVYFEKTNRGGMNNYFGLRSGVDVPAKEELISSAKNIYSRPQVRQNDGVLWMSASEVTFLRAEGAINGWSMRGEAQELYSKGVELSMTQHNVAIGAYLQHTGKRMSFIDAEYTHFDNKTFASDITVAWSGDKKQNLAQIITQKYIAMWPYGSAEAWAEWRRTGYPNLLPAIDYNHDIINIKRDEDGADMYGYRRYPLPQIEYDVNRDYVQQAVTNDLEGNDSPNTNVWWARK